MILWASPAERDILGWFRDRYPAPTSIIRSMRCSKLSRTCPTTALASAFSSALYDNPAVAKAYFDKVAEINELGPDTKRFLELKYREHQSDISEFDVENAKKNISLETPLDTCYESTCKEENVSRKSSHRNPESELHNSHDCSLEYKAFHRELANIEKNWKTSIIM